SDLDPGQARKAVRITLAELVDPLIGDLHRALDAHVAAAHRRQQGALDAGAVHLGDVVLDLDAADITRVLAGLAAEPVVGGDLAGIEFRRREDVRDDVDGFIGHDALQSLLQGPTTVPGGKAATWRAISPGVVIQTLSRRAAIWASTRRNWRIRCGWPVRKVWSEAAKTCG